MRERAEGLQMARWRGTPFPWDKREEHNYISVMLTQGLGGLYFGVGIS